MSLLRTLTRSRLRRLAGGLALAGAAAAPAHAGELADVQALLARGEPAAALARADAALQVSPRDAQLRFVRAVALMDLRRDDEALALLTQFSQEYPELPDPHNNIGLLHARAGRLDAARSALEAALRNDPTHRAARTNLGQVHLMLAVQAWEQAAQQGPLDPALLRRLEQARALLTAR